MILVKSELATAHVAGGARGYIVFPCRECFPPKRFKIAFGIASSAGPEYVGALTQSCQHRRTAGGFRNERGLRPESRNGFPRRTDQRKHEQATSRYFSCFQMTQLQTCLSGFRTSLVILWEYYLSVIPPKNDTSFYL